MPRNASPPPVPDHDRLFPLFRCDRLHHNVDVSHAGLSAARWQELSDESALNVARVIARENELDLVDVRGHEYAGRRQRIALFERAGLRFSLVPADRAALGYDGARFVPSPSRCRRTPAAAAPGRRSIRRRRRA